MAGRPGRVGVSDAAPAAEVAAPVISSGDDEPTLHQLPAWQLGPRASSVVTPPHRQRMLDTPSVRDTLPRDGSPRSILLVEDDAGDALVVKRLLATTATDKYELTLAARLDDARHRLLDGPVDCVILDLSLPDATGLETVAGIRGAAPDVPIVVLSSLHDERMAMRSLQHGAQDYLNKGEVEGALLWRAMRYAIERKRSELVLRHQAEHDALTGLANRTLFVSRLGLAVSRLARLGGYVAVLFLDLDRFKWVNDSLGHDAGDELIIQVASRVRGIMRPGDLVGRLGGDELLMLVHDVSSADEARRVADRVHKVLSEPFVVDDVEVRVTGSIGIAMTKDPAAEPEGLLRDADTAMYRAKARGKARSELFDEELRRLAQVRLQMETDLHRAIERGEFQVHYQPIVDLHHGHTVGVEALVRWAHPSGVLVNPDDFIAVAEETGTIIAIGDIVMRVACAQLAEWGHPAHGLPMLTVNLSARQLADPTLPARVELTIAETGIDPSQLCLEMTENSIMEDEAGALRCLQDLKRLGVRLAIDDFGTGYSSLTYLKLYPFDVLKIDRSFTAGLGVDDLDTAIVTAIVGLAQVLGLQVVVEGVETEHQADQLRTLGCGLAQGHRYSAPSIGSSVDISQAFHTP